jgi:TP901 family phage tail tape measure protein
MADVQKIIDIVFRGVDQTSSVTQSLSSGIDDFAGNLGKVTGPLADVADKALMVEGAVLAASAAFVGYAYAATGKFESAQLNLQKIMTDSEGVVADYEDQIFGLSNTYGVMAGNVLEGITNFKLAGFTVQESIQLMEDSIGLMIAGNVDAATSTEILVSILKGFKAPAEEATRVTDILNEVSNRYATNVTELGIGMAKLSPIASIMGFSFEETAGVLTPVIEIFRSGSEAANALKVGLLKLLDDAKPVQDALARLGVAQKDANGHLRSGRDILFDVGEAFKTADENDKLFLASQLVGIRQAGRMIEVFNGMTKATEITTVALNAQGSVAKEVAIRLSSIEIAAQRAIVAFNNITLAVGRELKDNITDMINAFTALERAISNAISDGALAPLLDSIKPIFGELEDLFYSMAENIPDALAGIEFGGLIDALGGLRKEAIESFEALFGEVDLTTTKGLTDVLQRITDGITALTRVVGGIIDSWEPFLGVLGAGIDELLSSDQAVQELVGTLLGWAQVLDKVVSNIGLLTGSLDLLGAGLSIFGAASIAKMVTGFNAITPLIGIATKATTAMGLLGAAGASFGTGWMVGSTLRLAFPAIDDWTQKMWAGVDSIINFTGTQGEQQESLEETQARLRENLKAVEEYKKGIDDASDSKITTEIEVVATGEDAEIVKGMLDGSIDRESGLPSWAAGMAVPWVFEVEVDDDSIEESKEKVETELVRWFDRETQTWKEKEFVITPSVDQEATDRELEKIPTEKMMEIKLQGEIDAELLKIEQEFITIRELAQIQASIDIAEIEAKTERIKAAFESVNVGIESTGKVISDMVGLLAGDVSLSQKYDIQSYLDREYAFREKEFLLQEKLVNSTMALNTAKKKFFAGEGGDAVIQIETSEVYPELDMVMLTMIQRAQIKANALGLGALLGIGDEAGE